VIKRACGRHAPLASLAAEYLRPAAAQANVATYHNDVACTASIAGGTQDAPYIVDQHNGI
jgi:hypothetical protein